MTPNSAQRTFPLTSASTSTPPPAKLTSQYAPHLNGSTKEPSLLDRLQRQPTIVDGFRPQTSDPNAPPQHPPPLKMQPISLPGTPTDTTFSPPSRQKSINNQFGWTSTQSGSDILSPLLALLSQDSSARWSRCHLPDGPSQDAVAEPLPSPKETPRNGKSPASPQDVEMASPTVAPLRNGKSKGEGKAPAVDLEELEARASALARTSTLRRVHGTQNEDAGSRAGAELETKVELARWLKENHEQHERRWAPGILLAAVRTHVGDPAAFDYCLWLSLNPEIDDTVIWVGRKFDILKSGAIRPTSYRSRLGWSCLSSRHYTALMTKLKEIPRPGRLCAIREVIETFPEDRHFIPSVLFILWGEDESEPLPDDLRRMADDYEIKGIIGSRATFSLSSDLDEKFVQVLGSMDLDTVGGFVEILFRQESLQLVIAPWKDFALPWVSRCSADGGGTAHGGRGNLPGKRTALQA
ncbi:hypothetical protein BJV78DRAFT_1365093, partial [Lactifluus subvellereus]